MTNPEVPSEEQLQNIEPSGNEVVTREDDEGIILEVNIIGGEAVDGVTAKTYTRGFGHYFVGSDSDATEVLDEFFAEFEADKSVLDMFQRTIGQAYEVTVTLDDSIKQSDYVFNRSNAAEVQIPSHSKYVDDIDEFLERLREDVSN